MVHNDQVLKIQKALEQGKKANVKQLADAQVKAGNRDEMIAVLQQIDHPDADDIILSISVKPTKKPTQNDPVKASSEMQVTPIVLMFVALIVAGAGIGTGFLINNVMNTNATANDTVESVSENNSNSILDNILPPAMATERTLSSAAEIIQATNSAIETQMAGGLSFEEIQANNITSRVDATNEAAEQRSISVSTAHTVFVSVSDSYTSSLNLEAFVDCVPERYSFRAHSDSGMGERGFIVIGAASSTNTIFYDEQFYDFLDLETRFQPVATLIYLDIESILPSNGATTSRITFFAPNASPFTQIEISMLGLSELAYVGAGTLDIAWQDNGNSYTLDGMFEDLTMREYRADDSGFVSIQGDDDYEADARFRVDIPAEWLEGCAS